MNPGETAGNGIDDDGNGFIDDVRGWDFNANDNNPLPAGSDSHGTHVGGIIAARSNNGVGVAGTAGGDGTAGSGVRLVGLRWDGANGWTAAQIAAAYAYAADNGVRIVNSSYNFDGFATNTTVTTALDFAYNAGVLLMLSAGNNGELDPARRVLTQPLFVASLDQNDARSSFSNYGSFVDLAGHGSSILSTTTNTNGTGVNYEIYSGTSMSTPHAAGVAALIWSANPTWTRDQVAAQMLGTTDNIYGVAGNVAGTLGTGRVNAFRALTQTLAAPVFTNFTLTGSPGAVQAVAVTVPRRLLPASVAAANFELRGNGADDAFGTADDVLIPVVVNGGAAYRMGTNELRFTQAGGAVLPVDRYRLTGFAGAGRLRDPFNTALDGNVNGTGGDDYVVEFGAEPSLAGRVYEDWAGNATADANDPGVAGRTVYLDANGNGSFDATLATTPFASGAINLAIPDNNTTGVTDTRTVSGLAGVVTKVTVAVNVPHAYVGDLVIDLTGPSGTTVTLVSNRGGAGVNFTNTVFDDAAGTAIGSGAAPFTGSFRPESPLSALAGGTPNGSWSLRVRDLGPADLGNLANWTLTLTTGEPAATTTAAGAYGFGALAAGTYTVRTVTPAGWSLTGPAGGAHTRTIAAGASVTGLNFGTVRQNAVYGQVVDDLDGDGFRDAGEPGTAGWRVFDDRNGNLVRDGGEASVVSGVSGNYVLAGAAAGMTTVRLERQSGFRATINEEGVPLLLSATATYLGQDFGAVADTTAPTADVTDVTPDPRTSAVGSMTIVFGEAVTGFDLSDLTLRRDGSANLLTGSQTLTTGDGITWTLGNLAGLTATPGTYVLTLTAAGSGVQDAAQNALAANAADTWAVVPVPTVSVSDVAVGEGGGPAVFTVTLSGSSPDAVTVPYATADGTATTADGDYAVASGVLTFAPGETSKTVSVAVANDARDEANETFVLNLGAPTNATTADGQGVATITDDDATPTLAIVPATRFEGSIGTTPFVFAVTLSAASGRTVTVNFATSDGTATTADGDYTATSGVLTFLPGETAKSITVQVAGDTRDEPDEGFAVALSGETNAGYGTQSAAGSIADDDPTPTLSVNSLSLAEGGGAFGFTVTLSAASGRTVTVNYGTADGTATTAGDYTAATGTLTFLPGETTKTIAVPVTDDARDEDDETFTVTLSGAANAGITTATGTGTITDDDPPPALSIGAVMMTEGSSGSTPIVFTVTLSAASGRTVSVDYATADGSATAADYAAASGSLTFAPGETTKTVTVQVTGDALDEFDETFVVGVSGAPNATIGAAIATGTITDDDAPPALAAGPVSLPEGGGPFAFTVTLSAVSGKTVTVGYATADGTATVADGDYTAAGGTLTFLPGETTKTITVPVTGDARDEDDETFVVGLSGETNATVAAATATGTITDDDLPPVLSIDSRTLAEGNSGSTPFAFTVSLSAASGRTVTVNYATADGIATVTDGDYTAASGTLTFAPGETTKTVTVQTAGDARNEFDETFTVGLDGATNATIGTGTGTGTVTNDDPLPTLSVSSAARPEGNSGSTPFVFTVSLSAVSGRTVTVNYATANGTATTADGDYVAASGVLTFAPGETSKTVTVNATGDTRNETDETFSVNLSGAANATVATGTGTGTITNDDPLPTLSVAAVTQAEGTGGGTTFTFTVTLSAASGRTVTVTFATADGTAAVADGDYTAAAGTLTFAPDVTTRTFTVAVAPDARNEDDETFGVTLATPTNATLAAAAAAGTITDDDPLPTLSVNSVSLAEGTGGSTAVTFTVALSAVSGRTVTVAYSTADGTATTADGDYTAASGTVTFAPGETSKTVAVSAAGDARNEDDETFALALGAAMNAVVAVGTGTATLTNDDPVPTLTIDSVTAAEGAAGTTAFTFTVSLSAVSGKTVTATYATTNGTATVADGDYVAASGTLTFAPGVTTQTFTVNATGDLRNEIDETFTATLSSAANATIAAGTGTATLVNDDPEPTLAVGSASTTEGTGLAFTVALSAVSGRTVTVNYATPDSTATAGSDYAAAAGTLTFLPGETSKVVAVATTGDDTFEPDETFTLTLSGAANAGVAAGTGTGTVANDDAEPTATLSGGGPVAEAGGAAAVVVTLSNPSYLPVTVTLGVGGTAAAVDFVAPPAGVTVPAGQLSASVTVTARDDADDEPDETVALSVGGVVNGSAGGGPVTVTLTDDDVPVAAAAGFDLTEDRPFATPTSLLAAANAQPGSVVELVGTAPAGGTLTLNLDGTFTFAPPADANGTVGFTYRVRNPAGEASAPAAVDLRVAAVNDPPTFAPGPDQTDPRRGGPQVVPGWATAISAGPPDESGQRLTFEVSTDNPGLFAVPPAIDPATGALTYTPGGGFGTAAVTVRLRDDAGGADASPARTFTVHVLKFRDDDLPTSQDEVGLIGVGSGDGGAVAAFRGDGAAAGSLTPFTGASARVVTADVTGDGVADTIAATGPGVRSRVVVIDGATRAVVRTVLPFEDTFTGGLFVAAADVDGDGRAEIAVSPDTGGGGRVTVFGAAGAAADFFGIDDKNFRGGARVAFGDVNGDGTPDLVVVAGFGGGPRTAI